MNYNISCTNVKILVTCLSLTVLVLIVLFLRQDYTIYYLKADAIDRGYALHCPKDGDFAWKGECDE